MPEFKIEDDTPVLFEFTTGSDVQNVGLFSIFATKTEEFKEKSAIGLERAMNAIQTMAQRIGQLHDKIPVEFSQVEVEFGIKLDWEFGPVITKAGVESHINVKLVWDRKDKK